MGSARVFHPRRVEPPDRWRWGSRWWPELCRHSRQSNEWRLPMQNNNHQRRPGGTNLEQGRYWSESFHGRRTYRDVLLAERSCETRRNNERVQQRQISPAHIQGEGSKSASLRYQFRRSQSQGNNQQRLNLLPGSFSIFVDGLGDRITHAKLRAIFAKAGRLREVFIQQKKKPHRRFRFGFVRFTCDDEARAAIRKFNGLRLEGNYLVVQKARFQRTFQTDRVPPPGKHQYEIRGWKLKEENIANNQDVVAQKQHETDWPSGKKESSQLQFLATDMDETWVQRCAQARTLSLKPVEILQEEFSQIGLFNFRLIPLGASEVILEFENKEEMDSTITECAFFLEQLLTDVKPCSVFTFGTSHFVWIRLWQVPLGLWNEAFFAAIGNKLGTFVLADTPTVLRHRADFARVLVRMNHPLLHCFTMAVDVGGTSFIILVEKDVEAHDYGVVEDMPSTPVKVYNSEEEEVEADDEVQEDEAQEDDNKDLGSATTIDPDEVDEIYRDGGLEGLRSGGDARIVAVQGGDGISPEEEAVKNNQPEKKESFGPNSNSNLLSLMAALNSVAEQKEQLRDIIDAGYSLEEIEGWMENLKADGILSKDKQIMDKNIQNQEKRYSVTGFSFNSKDLIQNNNYPWHFNFDCRDPRPNNQLPWTRTCLPPQVNNQNSFLSLVGPVSSSISLKQHENCSEFVHTTPNQIVRKKVSTSSLMRDESLHMTPVQNRIQPASSPGCETSPVSVSPGLEQSPKTNSSKKSSQRGRPKGSKNKPKPLPADYLEPVQGEDGVSTRAQRTWLLGKQLGLKPRGSEALMLRGLEAQIRQNHPHLN